MKGKLSIVLAKVKMEAKMIKKDKKTAKIVLSCENILIIQGFRLISIKGFFFS